ncbi:hypothetical protein COO60DRAFT_1497414 [Scenedesmus sp. NREL 46B-D3]|nr:hypothetical protein COO60DRAFT_1497414 [Scenedesmus sp. NREL 46B-D3]
MLHRTLVLVAACCWCWARPLLPRDCMNRQLSEPATKKHPRTSGIHTHIHTQPPCSGCCFAYHDIAANLAHSDANDAEASQDSTICHKMETTLSCYCILLQVDRQAARHLVLKRSRRPSHRLVQTTPYCIMANKGVRHSKRFEALPCHTHTLTGHMLALKACNLHGQGTNQRIVPGTRQQ